MTLEQIIAVFGRTMDSLQLAQCVGYIVPMSRQEREAHERVVLHCVCVHEVLPGLNSVYGGGVPLNEMVPIDARESAARDTNHEN